MRRKVIIFFIGLLTALFLLEAGLRLLGLIYRLPRSSVNNIDNSYQKNNRVILCLGNSWTEGGGAPIGKSYPDDLQRLFDAKFGKGKISVINGGWGNENTAELLDKLEAKIKAIKPILILLQTGQPNIWNYHKYSKYLKRESLNSRKQGFLINDLFYNSRVYRLICLLIDDIRNKRNVRKHNYVLREQVCSEFAGELQRFNKEIVADKQKVRDAIDCFKKGIDLYPDDPRNYNSIGLIYFLEDNYGEALEWFIKAVESNSDLDIKGGNRGYQYIRFVRGAYKGAEESEINKKVDNFVQEIKRKDPEHIENLFFLSDSEITNWLKSDIDEIVRIIRKEGIKIILQNYPYDPQAGARFIDPVLRKTANDLSIPFVDNELIFLEMMNNGAKRDDYFSPDYHCNARGYEIMAKNVYNKIIEEKIFDPEDTLSNE
jgi:lysophospholipase L1-like esterase